MGYIKPAELRTGHTSSEEIKTREETEKKLKGTKKIKIKPPDDLSENGKKFYKEILSLLPKGFLSGGDMYTVRIVAESLDCMQMSAKQIHDHGLFTYDGKENEASRIYERYSKIYEKFSGKIGLSPKDRAALAAILASNKEDDEDELTKILKGDDD